MAEDESNFIHPPWDHDTVAALNWFQQRSRFHPFTCPRRGHQRHPTLEARSDGWVCSDPACDYTQEWAFAFQASLPGKVEQATGE